MSLVEQQWGATAVSQLLSSFSSSSQEFNLFQENMIMQERANSTRQSETMLQTTQLLWKKLIWKCGCWPGMCLWIGTWNMIRENWNISVKNSSAHAQPCGRNEPILSALHRHTRVHTHTLTKNTSTLSLSHSCREFVLFKISRDLLVLFVICACKRLHMLECFRDLKWKMMQLMWQVSSTPEIKSLASCKLPARYRLSCPKSRLQVIIRRKSVCK